MFAHAHRHLPHIQRPHTRCLSYTRPLTHSCRFTHTHTIPLTHAGALTRGVSLIHGASATHTPSLTHGVLGSTHPGTLATTPLTHGVTLTPFTTHTGTFTLGNSVTSRAPGASIPPKLSVHPSAALAPSTPSRSPSLDGFGAQNRSSPCHWPKRAASPSIGPGAW